MSNDMYVHCVSNSCMSEYNLSKKKKNTVEPQNLISSSSKRNFSDY